MRFQGAKSFFCSVALLGATLAVPVTAAAQTVLRLSSWMPPQHANVAGAIIPWAKQVEEATEGRVKINVFLSPLGKPAAHFDMAANGIADITYGVQGYQPGRFVTAEAVELPFLGDSAEAMSVAYWRIFKEHLEKVGEYDDVQVLSVYTHGPGQLFNNVRAIKSLDDLNGIKMRVGGGAVNETAKLLGMQATSKPANEVYSLLSSGVLEGYAFPKETVKSYNLARHTKYATIVPGGFYNVSWFLAMNKDKFNALSENDQKAIMKVSGEHFARMAGKAWDAADSTAVDYMKDEGIDVHVLEPNVVQQMEQKAQPVEANWIKKADKTGLNGEQVLQDLRAEIDKVQSDSK